MARTPSRIAFTFAVAVAAGAGPCVPTAAAGKAGKVSCPLVFGHGGYPTGPDATAKDQVRQANNPSAVDDMKSWGADGVEADVQLTRDGTKAVMWHNVTTNGLDGAKAKITELWWAKGPSRLGARRITRGPYKGERVHTLRAWLAHVESTGLIALLEIKPQTKGILASTAHGAQAWKEISGPIRERQGRQRILVYSTDPWIQGELARRHPTLLKGSAARWADSAAWDEPAPRWTANASRWESVLAQSPPSVMTNYTRDYRRWLNGKCT
ncbi:glycerophosphodiester phosphodiesterase [Nonomuraea indica]|uniref:glycerophosphodiester phosphodiesterase n=1 Tax=Nonomuraea indica TaxID=1581193 RepID=UPI000C7D8B66|nr:glycerophosphodiester phosphodiesterase family protein [Nonomuraea indica]